LHFKGKVLEEDVPSVINRFDVCINPQKNNPITIGNYPRKIDEYLAMGKPVVALRTEAMEYFSDSCFLSRSNEEFLNYTSQLVNLNNTEHEMKSRRRVALTHSWENSIGKMMKVMYAFHEGAMFKQNIRRV